tara:strand:- start:525 stop:770 length:246 start_codon:yes stop_codon:yes gene_type:complete
MKAFIIVLVMMFPEGHVGNDALEITHNDGKPLSFKTFDECVAHINHGNNADRLIAYGMSQYADRNTLGVKNILCVNKGEAI